MREKPPISAVNRVRRDGRGFERGAGGQPRNSVLQIARLIARGGTGEARSAEEAVMAHCLAPPTRFQVQLIVDIPAALAISPALPGLCPAALSGTRLYGSRPVSAAGWPGYPVGRWSPPSSPRTSHLGRLWAGRRCLGCQRIGPTSRPPVADQAPPSRGHLGA